MSSNAHWRSRLGLLALVVMVGAARLAWAPPTAFVEGDDAALCAGIARLSQGYERGAYAYHPPKLPDDPSSASVWTAAAATTPSLALYRYNTMPGMYLIGRLSSGLGRIAERMSWLCFGAGTLLPLLISLFLVRTLRRPGVVAFGTCYLMAATAPEVWISGSAYINDKVVAATALFGALLLNTAPGGDARPLRPGIFLSGVLLGIAVAARFDTIIFVPAVIVALIADQLPKMRHWWLGTAACLSAAGTTVLAIWAVMQASLRGAWGAGAGRMTVTVSAAKLYILLSAYGPAQLGLCALTLVVGLHYALRRRPREGRDLFVGFRAAADRDRKAAIAAVLGRLSLLLLLLPEISFWLLFPFSSQKYLLVSSAMVGGLCGVLLPGLIALSVQPEPGVRNRRLELMAHATPLLIIAASFLVGFGTIRVGQDGPRPLGGQVFFRLTQAAGSREARRMIERVESAQSCSAPVMLTAPSWVVEQSIAYECAVHGWTYRLLPAGTSMTWEEALADGFFKDLSGFWEARGLRRARVNVEVAAYTPPGDISPAILVPSDWDLGLGLVTLPLPPGAD